MIKMLLADDHAIIRFGLKQIITEAFSNVSIREATTFDEAIGIAGREPIDLLILDINLPGGNSIQMLDSIRLRQPKIKILIFSALEEQLYAINYLQAGADGFLQKSSEESEVKKAIETILGNEKYLSTSTRQRLLDKAGDNRHQNPFDSLSAREVDIMNQLIKGTPVAKIAEILNLHISTVSTYKTRLYTKLGVTNIIELLEKIKPHNFQA
ncbi:response regulator transcription factor [Chitinophaga sedimenti]|uniref:response regulator n=1 Tax=Chitinophaga sedimenti TaxID=2033606 RepID=UPI002002C388|nr:response regulator transcription factor [Chitinophaga sedimenti]MCK7554154.1 response regulator transcription factor [Chitinophaga sedimenti]